MAEALLARASLRLMSTSVTPCLSNTAPRVMSASTISVFIVADSDGIAVLVIQVNFPDFAGVNVQLHRFKYVVKAGCLYVF